jgi:hypothetical protein
MLRLILLKTPILVVPEIRHRLPEDLVGEIMANHRNLLKNQNRRLNRLNALMSGS